MCRCTEDKLCAVGKLGGRAWLLTVICGEPIIIYTNRDALISRESAIMNDRSINKIILNDFTCGDIGLCVRTVKKKYFRDSYFMT